MLGRRMLRTLDTAVRRMPWLAVVVATATVCVIGFASQNHVVLAQHELPNKNSTTVVAREGTRLVDATGSFSRAGDRIIFHVVETGQSFVGLENLSLERVARQARSDQRDQLWNVTGTVTEFQGTNYVLISRVVLKDRASSARPAPRRLGGGR